MLHPFLALLTGMLMFSGVYQTNAQTDSRDFQLHEKKFYYRHFKNGGTIKPRTGDLVQIIFKFYTEKDSLFFNSLYNSQQTMSELTPPAYSQSFEHLIREMAKGDSALVIQHSDSVYFHVFQSMKPAFLGKNEKIKIHLFLTDIKSGEAKMKFLAENLARSEAEKEKRKNEEAGKIERFMSVNNLTATPTPSGLYFIEKLPGKGKKISKGNVVKVSYYCTSTDGVEIDNRLKNPLEVKVGAVKLIAGMEEGLLMSQKGTKGTLIIPSKLAFGDKQVNAVPPYSPLVYDFEILDVK